MRSCYPLFPCNPILNLSTYSLSSPEADILNKGINYIPINTNPSTYIDFLLSLADIFSKPHISSYLNNSALQYSSSNLPQLNVSNTATNEKLSSIASIVDNNPFLRLIYDICNTRIQNLNYRNAELRTLKQLTRNKNRIFLRSDKGNVWVILDTPDYIAACTSHLENPAIYEIIPSSNISTTCNNLQNVLNHARSCGHITQYQLKNMSKRLHISDPSQFYALPKIHKPQDKWIIPHKLPPIRPIISSCKTYSKPICEYLNSILFPIVKAQPFIIHSTDTFISTVAGIKSEKDLILVTMDVEALYTNIPLDKAIRILSVFLSKSGTNPPFNSFIISLLSHLLKNNEFTFNSTLYKQIKGIAMGLGIAPNIANLYMSFFENKLFSIPDLIHPILYCRYLDDIFCVFDSDINSVKNFINKANSLDTNIHLTFHTSHTDVQFLDLVLYTSINYTNTTPMYTINRLPYIKPSNTLSLIHNDSFHPTHIKHNTIHNYIKRLLLHSTLFSQFSTTYNCLSHKLISQGYTRSCLNRIKLSILKTIHIENDTIVRGFHPCNGCARCPTLPIYFHRTTGLQTHPIQHFSTCQTRNCVYIIECCRCNVAYIGETSQTFTARLCSHFSRIKHKYDELIYHHFNEPQHIIPTDVRYYIIEHNENWSNHERKQKETKWILKLNTTAPNGLNAKHSYEKPRYVSLPHIKDHTINSIISKSLPQNIKIARSLPMATHNFFHNKI